MIKVGQIYKTRFLGYICAVTFIAPNIEARENPTDEFHCILPNGVHQILSRATLEEGALLAEYPTWQEAVNNKEFNND